MSMIVRLGTQLARSVLLPALALLFCCGAAPAAEFRGGQAYHVLILHSYHPGLPWTDRIMAGIQKVLAASDRRIDVDVEYLDTKRHQDAQYFSHILDAILHYKLKGRTYDLVLLSDNEALNFVLEHRHDLFRSVPIVFCGINNDAAGLLPAGAPITGVRADPDFAGVIRQALAFHPRTREMVVIGSDRELTDRINQRRLKAVTAQFGQVTFQFWDDLPAETLRHRLAGLGADTVVLVNGSTRDEAGNLLSFNEQTLLLRQATDLPLYSFWGIYLGQGIVGGPLVSARAQGELAATMALRILGGEAAGSIPVTEPPPPVPAFDYQELKRLGIPFGSLPSHYRLINEPPSAYQLSRSQFWLAVAIVVSLLGITLILTTNILRRRRAEAELRRSEQSYKQLSQQFQIILDGIPDGLTLISPEMQVIWSNREAGNYFNQRLGSIPGEYCCKLLYNRTSICDDCPAVTAFQSGRDEEAMITTPDGRVLEVKAFPVKTVAGEISHVIMLASDVTDKKRLLEETIRSSRLASLGELAAGVAHEINNPNALILLNTELVKKSCADAAPILRKHFEQHGDFLLGGLPYTEMREEMPHLFGEMLEGAARIKRIVEDLKDFARADGPELREAIDVNEAVRAALRLAGNTIKNATNRLTTELAPGLPPFLGNLQRIEQVVVNLVMNACQALPDKEKGVAIDTYYDSGRRACAIRVRDEGVGIPRENLPHIADPFFTTKRESGGTGLGLSVSMRIVKDYGGTLEFHSVLNEGTTVYLYLPAEQEVSGP